MVTEAKAKGFYPSASWKLWQRRGERTMAALNRLPAEAAIMSKILLKYCKRRSPALPRRVPEPELGVAPELRK